MSTTYTYSYIKKETGERVRITPANEKHYFTVIESLTGLDETVARAILDSGRPIDHPKFQFQREGAHGHGG